MKQEQDASRTSTETESGLVNYLPGMPTFASDQSRFERFFRSLLKRRGPLRPVVGQREDTETKNR